MRYFVAIILISISTDSSSYELNNKALYVRCYSQLTQSFPKLSSQRFQKVASGEMSAVDACVEVFSLAMLNRSGNRLNVNQGNEEAKSVLQTFHALHTSWFSTKNYPAIANIIAHEFGWNTYDSTTPALYYTKAVFERGAHFKSAITEDIHIRPMRTIDNPSSRAANPYKEKSFYDFDLNVKWADLGELLGVEEVPNAEISNYIDGAAGNRGSYNFSAHAGGGFAGSYPYLMLTMNEPLDFRSDGGVKVPRRWSRDLIQDALCRELPLIRDEDLVVKESQKNLVDPTSEVSFRQTSACAVCHATMDPMSTVVRDFQHMKLNGQDGAILPNFQRPNYNPTNVNASITLDQIWPAQPNRNFNAGRKLGALYFRNYQGELVNEVVDGLPQLGKSLSQQDDFYICAVKRYYKYFTGIEVFTGDPVNIDPTNLSAEERTHRKRVIDLGIELKETGNVRPIIQKILESPSYRQSDFRGGQ